MERCNEERQNQFAEIREKKSAFLIAGLTMNKHIYSGNTERSGQRYSAKTMS